MQGDTTIIPACLLELSQQLYAQYWCAGTSMSARPISNDNNAFIDSELYVQHSGGGPLTGLRFAAKDLFDVSTDLECDAPNCELPVAIELAAVYT